MVQLLCIDIAVVWDELDTDKHKGKAQENIKMMEHKDLVYSSVRATDYLRGNLFNFGLTLEGEIVFICRSVEAVLASNAHLSQA